MPNTTHTTEQHLLERLHLENDHAAISYTFGGGYTETARLIIEILQLLSVAPNADRRVLQREIRKLVRRRRAMYRSR